MRCRWGLRCLCPWLIAFLPAAGLAQFSPGPLSKAHHALDGPVRCTNCHAIVSGERRFRCLGCHVEIRQRLAQHRGLHATLLKGTVNEQNCFRCHSEHNGVDFVPIRWDVSLDEFDHRETGYPLEGKHAGLECKKCHTPKNVVLRKGLQVKDLARTYLGLSRACASCHADVHKGQLGAECQRCHEFTAWKNVTRFDHATARFPLTGAHVKVACQKCHPSTPETPPMMRFVGLAFQQCAACHKDAHQGAFHAPCQACHNDTAWKPARVQVSTFDHATTKFPLNGKHAAVACEKCHKGSDFKKPIAFARCMDCHLDQHKGQFLTRADKGECGSCHVVDEWKRTTFTVAAHALTKYPLEARHATVACAKCHLPKGLDTVYKVKFDRCNDCHQDPHQGQFATDAHFSRCQDCHTVQGFKPSTFTLTMHRETRFALEGGHVAVPCVDCHREAAFPPTPGRYHFQDLSCTACHQDPHRGEFTGRMAASGAGCQTCHSVAAWKEVTAGFDHDKTEFPLSGAHRAVACGDCHKPADLSLGLKSVSFRAAPQACAGCHEDVHGGQFAARREAGDCSGCHTTFKWKPGRFDHDRDTAFQLTGAHKDVACRQCHKLTREINGKVVRMYKPTPKECSACHGTGTETFN